MPVKKDISMADLMEQSPSVASLLSRGDVLSGQIISLGEKEALVDLGVKAEGILPFAEATDASSLKPGQDVLVYVLATEDRRGQMLVSTKKAQIVHGWRALRDSLHKGVVITAKITGFNKGGVVVDMWGLQGFLPFSHLVSVPEPNLSTSERQSVLDRMKGLEVQVRVLELDITQNRIIVSEKGALAVERKEKQAQVLGEIEADQVIKVEVKKVLPFGLMVSYQGVEALIPKAELAWDISSVALSNFEPGQELEAKVLEVPRRLEGRAKLSLRAMSEDPWMSLSKGYEKGELVAGKVIKITSAGVVVRLEQGLEWSVPLSELSQDRELRAGDKLRLKIKFLDVKQKRLELGSG